MARISKSGISNGNTIDASHITRIIEALDGTGSADIYATGSFTGSFRGNGSGLTGITTTTALTALTASTILTTSKPGDADGTYYINTVDSHNLASDPEVVYTHTGFYYDTNTGIMYLPGNPVRLSGVGALVDATSSRAITASFARTSSYIDRLNQNVIITGSLLLSGSGTTSLTVQKNSQFNNTASFNTPVNIGGCRFEDVLSVTTTDASQTNVWTYAMASPEAMTIEAFVIGISSSYNAGLGSTATSTVGGNVVGVVRCYDLGASPLTSVAGQTSSIFENFSGTPSFGITADGAGGNNAYVYVTGQANTTIEWQVSVKWNSIRSGVGGS